MDRSYRRFMSPGDLTGFRVVVGETDLWVAAETDLSIPLKRRVEFHRRQLKAYIARDPLFADALVPIRGLPGAPPLIARMLSAADIAGVGPMAAVAGAIAQAVGEDLRAESPEIIIENGGDLFLRSRAKRTIAVLAGESCFSGRLGMVVPPCPDGFSVCTSAGTVGPSLSLGRADAAVVAAEDAALADAVATALGNRVKAAGDLEAAVSWATSLPGVRGALAVLGSNLAASGEMTLCALSESDRREDNKPTT
ncbi:MAG: UPF0280 family protein [Bacteroidota bacterium]